MINFFHEFTLLLLDVIQITHGNFEARELPANFSQLKFELKVASGFLLPCAPDYKLKLESRAINLITSCLYSTKKSVFISYANFRLKISLVSFLFYRFPFQPNNFISYVLPSWRAEGIFRKLGYGQFFPIH